MAKTRTKILLLIVVLAAKVFLLVNFKKMLIDNSESNRNPLDILLKLSGDFNVSNPIRNFEQDIDDTLDQDYFSNNLTNVATIRPELWKHAYVGMNTTENKTLNFHCHRCAIVSSSGQLLSKGAGREIDSNQCVFRMNAAPIRGFEEDVGKKCTLRVVAHASASPLKQRKEELLTDADNKPEKVIFWGPEKFIRREGAYKTMMSLSAEYGDIDFYLMTDEQIDFVDKLFEKETGKNRRRSGSWLTTGLFSMVLALQFCDEIHVYGMIDSDYCRDLTVRDVPYHYYAPKGGKECATYNRWEIKSKSAHRLSTEKLIFTKWSLSKNISFHYPQWTSVKKLSNERTHFMKKLNLKPGY